MKQKLTNVGKKEQRQIDRLLTKEAQEDRTRGGKEAEAQTVPKAHRLRGGRNKSGG